MSNIGIAEGRTLEATGCAAERTAGCASKRARASSRGSGSTVPRGDGAAARAGVTGGGATGCDEEHAARPSAHATHGALNCVMSGSEPRKAAAAGFIEFVLRS
jgi:hypothetical protein